MIIRGLECTSLLRWLPCCIPFSLFPFAKKSNNNNNRQQGLFISTHQHATFCISLGGSNDLPSGGPVFLHKVVLSGQLPLFLAYPSPLWLVRVYVIHGQTLPQLVNESCYWTQNGIGTCPSVLIILCQEDHLEFPFKGEPTVLMCVIL